jgi:hypothetical protein
MNLYTAVLFVHAIAVLMLTAALTMEAWTVMQLRRAASPSAAGPWTEATQSIAIAAISSLVIIYATGAWLTESLRSWALAWPRLAVLEIVLFALFGAITGRRMRAIRRYAASENANRSEWNALTQSGLLKVSVSTRIWIVMGTTLLMTTRPGLRESLLIVVCSLILGVLFSFVSFGRGSAVSTFQTGSR